MCASRQNYSDKCVTRICQFVENLDFTENFKLHHWPILGFTFGLLAVTVPFSISVLNGHVYIFFPYISNIGALPPESCILGLMFDIGATILTIILYIRYRQVDAEIDSGAIGIGKEWNSLSQWLGFSLPVGLCVVGHFQETSIYAMHIVGALLALGFGSGYFLMQTRISFADKRRLDAANPDYKLNKRILYARTFLSLALYPLFATTVVFGALAMEEFKGKSMVWWTEEDGGFEKRFVSTFSEWLLVFFMFVFILTYTHDFKTLTFKDIKFSSIFRN